MKSFKESFGLGLGIVIGYIVLSGFWGPEPGRYTYETEGGILKPKEIRMLDTATGTIISARYENGDWIFNRTGWSWLDKASKEQYKNK